MPRIAIVGSCITRDLWPIRGDGVDGLLYVSRSGLASLLAPPVEGLQPYPGLPGDLRRHEHNALLADLQKTAVARLLAFRPTHVIFDFIDERYDLLAVGQSLVTETTELHRSGYLRQPALAQARHIPRRSAAAERLWLEAAAEFAALVRATPLGQAHLILHIARWAEQQRWPDGTLEPVRDVALLPGRPVAIDDYNDLLARQEEAFVRLMPPMTGVSAHPHRLADPQHQWGLSPFHYVPEYYAEVRRQLIDLGLGEAFSDAPDAPSTPAA